MNKSYGKEAYEQLGFLQSSIVDQFSSLEREWKEQFRRLTIPSTHQIPLQLFHVTEVEKIDLCLSLVFQNSNERQCFLYIDNVFIASFTQYNNCLKLSTSVYLTPKSTMLLTINNNIETETMLIHCSSRGKSIILDFEQPSTKICYTQKGAYILSLLDDEYYLSQYSLEEDPKLITFGKTAQAVKNVCDFAAAKINDTTAMMCVIYQTDTAIIIQNLLTNTILQIPLAKPSICSVLSSSSGLSPIIVLYKDGDQWILTGVQLDFTLAPSYTCTRLDQLLISTNFKKLQGVTSMQGLVGENGFLAQSIDGKILYFMLSTRFLDDDILYPFCLNIKSPLELTGVEKEDGIHLLAKYHGYIQEYLLTTINGRVKLTSLATYPNAQEIMYLQNKTYIVYEDQLYESKV